MFADYSASDGMTFWAIGVVICVIAAGCQMVYSNWLRKNRPEEWADQQRQEKERTEKRNETLGKAAGIAGTILGKIFKK